MQTLISMFGIGKVWHMVGLVISNGVEAGILLRGKTMWIKNWWLCRKTIQCLSCLFKINPFIVGLISC